MQGGQGMLVLLLSMTGHSSKEPVPAPSPGPMGTWEKSFAACRCFWPPGIFYYQSKRSEEMQSQAEGVNPALHPSKSLQEIPAVAPNKPQARHESAPRGAGDNSLQQWRQTQRAGIINRALGALRVTQA